MLAGSIHSISLSWGLYVNKGSGTSFFMDVILVKLVVTLKSEVTKNHEFLYSLL
ncbi:hypothetical protein SAMN05878482_107161 [Peribacillus simplex]|uniref:Uncharacterized protein n=1 Tax=Peribacillus simplex TaxID=1478 RepID=A0A9X8RCU2_9BACI|nr:hypothetical protein SAMN05878482_107161 [Peribacillus simplex]